MTADQGAREAAAQPDWVDCEHHWVSKHQPDFPDGIRWVSVCSFCDRIDGSDLAGQLADALAAAGLLAAPAGDDRIALLQILDDHRAAVAAYEADPRLAKIAEFHRKYVDEHGGTRGDCGECDMPWPCATYRWATADPSSVDINCTWDLADCEFPEHGAHDADEVPS